MIFPSRLFILITLCAGLPAVVGFAMQPAVRNGVSVIGAVFFTLALIDVLRCLKTRRCIKIIAPDHLRMYRGIKAHCTFQINSCSSVNGLLTGYANDQYSITADTRFSINRNIQSVQCPLQIVPFKRGTISSLKCRISIFSSWKLWIYTSLSDHAVTCSVFANNKKELHLINAIQTGDFAGNHLKPLIGKGREVDRLRNYVSGDSMGDIHWKATARHGFPITKEYRVERSQSIYVVIDTSCFSKRTIDYQTIPDQGTSIPVPLIERAVITADILLMMSGRNGDRSGLVVFDNKVNTFIPADSGIAHLVRCRQTLVDLQPGSSPADYREMFQYLAGAIHRRSMILILADLDDPFTSDSFSAYSGILTQRHIVCGVCPVHRTVQPLFSHSVTSEQEIYSALSGHIRWQSIKKLQLNARKKGCEIVISPNDSLTTSAIGAYIAMKRKQMV
jgi:hypothetical protein